jgi:hypothetical protein
MPRGKTFAGFSGGFLAFAAGVAVGANWPRASNFIGFILQRLGFEFTDLALWMWDPEKSLAGGLETTTVRQLKSNKRTQTRRIQAGTPTAKKRGARTKKSARSPGRQSAEGIIGATRMRASSEFEPGISNASAFRLEKTAIRNGRKKPKRSVARKKRKTQAAKRGEKIATFSRSILPVDAGLN